MTPRLTPLQMALQRASGYFSAAQKSSVPSPLTSGPSKKDQYSLGSIHQALTRGTASLRQAHQRFSERVSVLSRPVLLSGAIFLSTSAYASPMDAPPHMPMNLTEGQIVFLAIASIVFGKYSLALQMIRQNSRQLSAQYETKKSASTVEPIEIKLTEEDVIEQHCANVREQCLQYGPSAITFYGHQNSPYEFEVLTRLLNRMSDPTILEEVAQHLLKADERMARELLLNKAVNAVNEEAATVCLWYLRDYDALLRKAVYQARMRKIRHLALDYYANLEAPSEDKLKFFIQVAQDHVHTNLGKEAVHLIYTRTNSSASGYALAQIMLDHPDVQVRWAAFCCLAAEPEKSSHAIEQLFSVALCDPSEELRNSAVKLLAKIGTPKARQKIIELLMVTDDPLQRMIWKQYYRQSYWGAPVALA